LNGALTLEVGLALLLAALFIRYLPVKVLTATFLAYLSSVALIVGLLWLDLDKLALVCGWLAALGALYGVPWLMRADILAYPPFGALIRRESPDAQHPEVRHAMVATLVLLIAAVLGAYAIQASVLVFEIAEQIIDKGAPS
jgi:hypothetical protein